MQIIIAPINLGASGLEVANLQDALLLLLGKTDFITDDAALKEKLAFSLAEERASQVFGDGGTLMSVKLFQAQQQLEVTGEVDTPTADALNTVLRNLGALDPDVPRSVVVSGQITWQDDSPAIGVTVTAFDCDMNSEQKSGTATTHDEGRYEIRFRVERIRRTRKQSADVRIEVAFDTTQKPFSSDTYHKVTAEKTIDLKLPVLAPNTPSELDGLLSTLEPLLDGVLLADLNARHIDFLVDQTGIERQRIEWASLAARSARDMTDAPAIPLAMFYAWIRLDLPAEPNALWATPTETLLTSLRTAIAQNIVPLSIGADLESVSRSIEHVKLDRVLQAPALGTAASLGDLLATLPERLNPGQQRAIAAAITDLRPDDPKLIERIANIPDFDGNKFEVARTLRLGALTGGQLPLTQALQSRLRDEPAGTLRPLAALRPDEWINLAYTHGVPEGTTLTPVAYAGVLAANMERQFPTAALAAHLTDGRRLAQQPLLADVGTFLRDNPAFEIETANLNMLAEHTNLGGITAPQQVEQLVDGLRALQRMHVLNANWEETATLLDNDLHSPQQLLAAGPGQLNALLEGQLAPERVTALYRQAETLQSTTLAAFTAAFSPLSGPQVLPRQYPIAVDGREINPDDLGGLGPITVPPKPFPDDDGTGSPVVLVDWKDVLASGSGYDPKKYLTPYGEIVPSKIKPLKLPPELKYSPHAARTIADQPTLQALFGDQDACACGHCNSVLSPAAYFVDVLQFIKNANLLEPLLKRRPDQQDIELSCNNTNTVVPAIDLALEILENAVAFPIPVMLEDGIELAAQLSDGQIVGTKVKEALQSTVRNLVGELRAIQEGDAWTVVDGYRRWKLTAPPQALMAGSLAIMDLDLPAVIAALDQTPIGSDAKEVLERLFASSHRQPIDLANYGFTVTPTPLATKKSWHVDYRCVAQLVTDHVSTLMLRTPPGTAAGVVWWGEDQLYHEALIQAVEDDLSNGIIRKMLQDALADRFYKAIAFTVSRVDADTWAIIETTKHELTLHLAPAALTLVSLTYQSGDPNADAVAWPENHNPAAYALLKGEGVAYPWSLPVDLPLEEVRLFLDRARTSRLKLIELMLPLDTPLQDDVTLALEVLGLSEVEAKLIFQPLPALTPDGYARAVYANWGISSDIYVPVVYETGNIAKEKIAPLDYLKSVLILLQRSRLSFEELQAVLATRFVTQSGAAPLRIQPQLTCKPSEMTLPELTPAHLDRIHRFVRLWRKLGWTLHELDMALEAFGGQLQPDTLTSLARLQQLKQQLELPVTSLVASVYQIETLPWIDYLAEDAPVQPSLYATIFQREAVRSVSDYTAFALSANGLELKDTLNVNIRDHADYIGGCLRIKPSVVADWVSSTTGLKIEDRLNRANLSRIVAATNLCRALGIAPETLTHHLQLYGATASPFQTPMSAHERAGALLKFVKRFRLVERAGIDVETLRYVLEHYIAPVSKIAPISNVDLDEKQLMNLAVAAHDAVRSIPDALANTPPTVPVDPESVEARVARENETIRIVKENATAARVTRTAREDAAIAALATGLGTTRELMDDLLRSRLRHPSDAAQPAIDAFLDSSFMTSDVPQPIQAAIESVLVRLHKTVMVCDALKLGRAGLRLLRPTLPLRLTETDTNGFTALDFNGLPVAFGLTPEKMVGFERLLALAQLRRLAPGMGDLLHRYAAIDFEIASTVDVAHTMLATAVGLELVEVEATANQLQLTADQYRDPIALTRLIELLIALKQLGATVQQAVGLTAPSPTDAAAISARELLRGKYGEAQWHDLVKPIADTLRERQRNALVDYLVARDGLRGADDLYERYLIDVQTGSCLKTTRLLQATAAAQLFVQRVILNLEADLSKSLLLTPDKRAHWDWMHLYRVWEANRKVFLFPENWLLPELRDDKTAIFRQMESVLTEQEPSPEITRAALLTYLEELGDLAQISVIAMYEDRRKIGTKENPEEKRTLYVVGRTPNEPYRYYWRSCTEFGSDKMSWSGWEAIDLDNANDFIMPFVFEGDLHIAWPIFRKTTEGEDKLQLLWKVQIAWMRHTEQGWVKRKIGHEILSVQRLLAITELNSFVFRVRKSKFPISTASKLLQESITVDCYVAEENTPILEYKPNLVNKASGIKHSPIEDPSWNVWLAVNGSVWEHYKLEGHDVYRPVHDMNVTLEYVYHFNRPDNPYPTLQLNAVYQQGGRYQIGPIRVISGGDFTVTFARFGETLHEIRGKTVADNNKAYQNWTWDRTLILEIAVPSDTPYYPARAVKFEKASGSFVLTSGHDIQILNPSDAGNLGDIEKMQPTPMQRLGNQFVWMKGTHAVRLPGDGYLTVHPEFGARVQLTFATTPTMPALGEPRIWHLQDTNCSYYVRNRNLYPDGQDFVGVYRGIASASMFQLFDPLIQGMQGHDPQEATRLSTELSTISPAISFNRSMPYANYNWELFLHTPLAIADYLASQQRFEDARRWLHTVFDPTIKKDNNDKTPQFWRFLEFKNDSQPDSIEQMLIWLADPNTTDPKVKNFEKDFADKIEQWEQNPFMPHAVARLRPSAYQWHTFFAYLDVLIGWGDQKYRRDTRESVNEATLLYVLAAKLLGPRPRVIPAPTTPPPQTYRSLLKQARGGIDRFSNAWVSYSDLPGVRKLTSQAVQRARSSQALGIAGLGDGTPISIEKTPPKTPVQILASLTTLAFCIPQNEKLTEFYDRIENRLFNVRNCRNIEGVFRDLPLYEPPIDPLLLIRARAAGLNIDAAMAELDAPLPNYRFSFTLQKALDLCAELKSLGNALLVALEKKDAEELTLLRSSHEIAILKLVRDTRQQQIAEADANIEALRQSEVTILERFGQYQKLLGKPGVTKGQDGLPVVEQSSTLEVAQNSGGGTNGLGLSGKEVDQLNLTSVAHGFTQAANSMHAMAGILAMIPNIWAGAIFAGQTMGGSNLGNATTAIARSIEMGAAEATYFANLAGTFGGYERRQDEWVHQSKLALTEMKAIQKQILAAEIRKSIADHELSSHETQMENAASVDEFMRSKFTNKQLYGWMSSQIAQVYFRTYQLAFDQAQRAERAFQFELGLDSKVTPFVQAGQWDSLKRGLLAGEHLHHNLKRIESAYLERNVREFELTKHVSLIQLEPLELMKLRETGRCSLKLPEEIFDLDYPGHYFRRIKSVSITLPCVAGPYTTISCTLRLTKNSIRIKTTNGTDGYRRNTAANVEDSRFVENHVPVTAIAASGGQNDSGVFELSFRDERYLPFEGAGVVSEWSLELFNDSDPSYSDFGKPLRQFDYKTISDATLHVKYTAREDTGLFKNRAVKHLRDYFEQAGKTPSLRMFNLRQEFPTQWHRFLHPTAPAGPNVFELAMSPNLFRLIDGGKTLKVNSIWLLARCTNEERYEVVMAPPLPAPPTPPIVDPNKMILIPDDQYGGLHVSQKGDLDNPLGILVTPTSPLVTWQLRMMHVGGENLKEDTAKKVMEVEDLILVLGYEWG